MTSHPQTSKGVLFFEEGEAYFRKYVGRNPISGKILYEDYRIDTNIEICIEIDDAWNGLVFKKNPTEKVLTFSVKPKKPKEDNVP